MEESFEQSGGGRAERGLDRRVVPGEGEAVASVSLRETQPGRGRC